ncbi:MAG TPA: GNAT family N-acetyltransferase [Mycobacteriales bacterium]|nr:GNAT family N-acetyltransferase [Mycobacteriales bacterium]
MADVSVRPARPSDAPGIARVQLATWQAAYAEVLPAAALALAPEDVAAAWAEAVGSPPSPHHRVLVALDAEQVVGLAACEPAVDEDLDGPAAELTALLVEPRWGRRGHGSRLVAAAVDLWREEQVPTAVTWVFESDTVVADFLTAAGWGADTAGRTLSAEDATVRQRRWHTAL